MAHRRFSNSQPPRDYPNEEWARRYGVSGPTNDGGLGRFPGSHHARRGPKNYQRSDERLQELVAERLRDDPQIDASEVQVRVHQGQVTLEGLIDSRLTKYLAEEAADQIAGVKEVYNHLRLRDRNR